MYLSILLSWQQRKMAGRSWHLISVQTPNPCKGGQRMVGKSVIHLKNISVQGDWETPWPIFENICRSFKVKPILDVCATHRNTKCPDFFTPQMDGLMQEWTKDFWMNPPYENIMDWIGKASEMHNKYNVTGTALTYSKTDTKWWHNFIENRDVETHFLQGRLRFEHSNIPSKNSAPYPSVVIIMRAK